MVFKLLKQPKKIIFLFFLVVFYLKAIDGEGMKNENLYSSEIFKKQNYTKINILDPIFFINTSDIDLVDVSKNYLFCLNLDDFLFGLDVYFEVEN